ncbi:hypothetical protein GCM10020221_10790 [Streptomyces thioluteus]|uniref:Uncharacterized protein n=1 Tax=Streptomyces thioluteus TaxID=66431 RepID=A0ABN3WK60_STRTU
MSIGPAPPTVHRRVLCRSAGFGEARLPLEASRTIYPDNRGAAQDVIPFAEWGPFRPAAGAD